jgi:hypothetical protein
MTRECGLTFYLLHISTSNFSYSTVNCIKKFLDALIIEKNKMVKWVEHS